MDFHFESEEVMMHVEVSPKQFKKSIKENMLENMIKNCSGCNFCNQNGGAACDDETYENSKVGQHLCKKSSFSLQTSINSMFNGIDVPWVLNRDFFESVNGISKSFSIAIITLYVEMESTKSRRMIEFKDGEETLFCGKIHPTKKITI